MGVADWRSLVRRRRPRRKGADNVDGDGAFVFYGEVVVLGDSAGIEQEKVDLGDCFVGFGSEGFDGGVVVRVGVFS